MLTGEISGVTEDVRVMMRGAVNRIKEIANNLAKKSNANSQVETFALPNGLRNMKHHLWSVMEQVVVEKQVGLGKRPIEIIMLESAKCYEVFSVVNATELKRAFSNLINNSIEAFSGGRGRVELFIGMEQNRAILTIKDNGVGIPESVLSRLTGRGETFGKPSVTLLKS